MKNNTVVFTLTHRHLRWLAMALLLLLFLVAVPQLGAQKVQEEYNDKFKVATEDGGIAVATSSDGKYVYIVGKRGLIMSDDYGKTGSWVQTLRLK